MIRTVVAMAVSLVWDMVLGEIIGEAGRSAQGAGPTLFVLSEHCRYNRSLASAAQHARCGGSVCVLRL